MHGRPWLSRVDARGAVTRFVTLRWVPLTAALLSLVLSVTSIVISTRDPEVILILPDQVRVAQGRSTGAAFVYLQPAFVSTGANDRVEVIADMDLRVEPPASAVGSGPVTLTWDEQVRLTSDATGTLSYEYVADAVPLLVSPRSAAAPLGLFQAPAGWFFGPGTYRFTLRGRRVVSTQPLEAAFAITLSAADLAVLDAPGPDRFLTFPLR